MSTPEFVMPIQAEVWQYRRRVSDVSFESFEDAAWAAAVACDENTAAYQRAWNTETGEEWDRERLLDVGWRAEEKYWAELAASR